MEYQVTIQRKGPKKKQADELTRRAETDLQVGPFQLHCIILKNTKNGKIHCTFICAITSGWQIENDLITVQRHNKSAESKFLPNYCATLIKSPAFSAKT
jgi:hypothetical protein